MHAIDTDIATNLVKVNIAGLSNRIVQIHFAVTTGAPVAIAMGTARQTVVANAHCPSRNVGGTGFECSKR